MRISINNTTLYQTSNDDECHQLTFNFMTPLFPIGRTGHDIWAGEYKTWGLELDSKVLFRRYSDGTWWNLLVRVLGFGFGISKQDGY